MKKKILPKKNWKAYLQNVKIGHRWIVHIKARSKFLALCKLSQMYGFNSDISVLYITLEDDLIKEL